MGKCIKMVYVNGVTPNSMSAKESKKMAMTYVDGNVWHDREAGFYFEVKEAKIISDTDGNKVAILDVAYDMVENAEVTTYRRRAYREANSITGYFTVVNGLKIALKYDLNVNAYTVSYISKQYDTKGYKKLSTGIGSKGHQEVQVSQDDKVTIKEESKVQEPTASDWNEGTVRHEKYESIKACLEAGIPVYLAGPAGSGKNFTVEQICEELGWDFYFSNSIQQEYKLTGFIDAGGNYHDTEFYKACTSENDCVFFLDEIDASIPEVLVLLNAAIANGYFEFPEGRKDLKHVHFVAAGNTVGSGADEMYTGRLVIDQATLDRFAIIDFGYDTNVELHLAYGDKQLVRFIHHLRESAQAQGIRATFSYRAIMMVVKLQPKLKLKEVIAIAVFKGLDKDTVKQLVSGASLRGLGDIYSEAALEMVA